MIVKTKLNSIDILISKALIVSNIGQDEFVLINNTLEKYHDMKEEIKNLKNFISYLKLLKRLLIILLFEV